MRRLGALTNSTQTGGPDALEESLGRLSKKAGFKATIVLDRASGATLKTSGQISSVRTSKSGNTSLPIQTAGAFSSGANATTQTPETQEGAEELASIVWNFVHAAGVLVGELDAEARRPSLPR